MKFAFLWMLNIYLIFYEISLIGDKFDSENDALHKNDDTILQ